MRRFANLMITEHTATQSRIDAWASSNATNPNENDASTMLRQDAMAARAALAPLSGAAFDAAYVDSQVTMHEEALAIIDGRVLPGATDQDFRTLAMEIRADVDDHLAQAMALRDGLAD